MEINGDSPFYASYLEDIDHIMLRPYVNELWVTIAGSCHIPIRTDFHSSIG